MTKASRLWLLLPALLALVWFWPTLSHGFRSDDFLSVYYYDRDAGAVKWGRVLEEWVRPWFGVRDLYRPLVSLSLGINWALSTSPFSFHLCNVLLLSGTATCIAACAMRLAHKRAVLAALVAGAVVVLHPAAVEPTAWVSARTTGLQVFWSAVAYWSFLRWRDRDGGLWLPGLAVAMACASKEGAVLLPASLVVLDLLRGGRPGWRTHLPFFLIVGGYLAYRKLLLGVFTTAEDGHTVMERVSGAMALLRQLAVPPLGIGWWGLAGIALLAVRAQRSWWCLPWAALLLLPGTTHAVLNDNELAGRFVFDAVPALALFVAVAVDRAGSPLWHRLVVVAGVAVLAVGWTVASRAWLTRYGDEAAHIDAAQRAMIEQGSASAPGKPFGVVGLPGLPLLQPQLWGFLTQRPFAARDQHTVGLSNILTKDPAARSVFMDTTVIHALVAEGAGSAMWDPASRKLVPVVKAEPGVVEFVQDPADPRRFLPPRLLPPTAVAKLRIESATPVELWRAKILGNFEDTYAVGVLLGPTDATGLGAWLDTEHVLPWMVAATFGGGPAGIVLTADGEPPPAGTRVFAHSESPLFAPPQPLVSAVVHRRALATTIQWPDDRRWYRLFVLLPTGLLASDVDVRSGPKIDAATMAQLDFVCDVLGPCRVHWLVTNIDGGGPGQPSRRSSFGSCVLR